MLSPLKYAIIPHNLSSLRRLDRLQIQSVYKNTKSRCWPVSEMVQDRDIVNYHGREVGNHAIA